MFLYSKTSETWKKNILKNSLQSAGSLWLIINAAAFPWTWHGLLSKLQGLPCLLALTRPTFCILLFNWDSQETLSKEVSAKRQSPIKQPKLSPVTNYPAQPQRNRRSPDYISCCCIVNGPLPAVTSLIRCYCADAVWCLTPTGLNTPTEIPLNQWY